MTKRLLRLLRIAPLALLFAGIASAQTTGTIIGVVTDASTGKPVAGAVVIATSPNLQGEQTAVTDGNGNYRLVQLPPGDYKLGVQLEGYKPFERSDIVVRVDRTIRTPLSVVPEAVQMEEQVVRTGAAPVVNIGSAESGAVVSREFLASVPVGRTFDAVAATVPTARFDPTVGVSFAGAQAPENQYLIDGLNTTDPVYGNRSGEGGANGATTPGLRNNFVEEVDVKTGNFGAEYGRATGGIVNVVLGAGSNEYHGSVFSNLSPHFLVSPDGEVVNQSGDALYTRSKASAGSYDLDFGFEGGGPILKDKLWFYAGFAPVYRRAYTERFVRLNTLPSDIDSDPATPDACPDGYTPDGTLGQCVDAAGEYLTRPSKSDEIYSSRNTYQWVGKLTYLLDENNTFTLSSFGSPSTRRNITGNFFGGGLLGYSSPSRTYSWSDDGQNAVFARYGGKFLDKKLIVEVQGGWFGSYLTPKPRVVNGVDQRETPVVEWLNDVDLREFEDVPGCTTLEECPVHNFTSGGRGGFFENTTNRFAGKATASYLFDAFGLHNVKAGVDLERVNYEVTQFQTGGAWYLYNPAINGFVVFRSYGDIRNPGIGPGLVQGLEIGDYVVDPDGAGPLPGVPNDRVSRFVGRNKSQTDSFAYFVQDSWAPAVLPNLTLNYGLRLETQEMKNLDFESADGFSINDNWSPRLQAIYDFTGTGRSKVAASWGRFYYAMPLNMGNRSFGNELDLRFNLQADTCGFTGDVSDFDINSINAPGFPQLPGATVPTTCQLRPRGGANNDFRLFGGFVPVDPDLKGQYVDMFGAQAEYEVLSDLSVGVEWNARRQGYVIEDMSSNEGGTYFIGNPGKDATLAAPDYTCATPPCTQNSSSVEAIDPATGRPITIAFPEPERSYDGLTFKALKVFSRNWLAQASYTYSVLRGNYSGPYYPEYGQLDPGITGEYDLPSLMANKTGILPGDQTHQIKLYGAYNWNIGPRFNATASAAYEGVSGQPVSVLGSHPLYGSGSSFVIQRGQGGRTPFQNNVDLGAGLSYVVRAPYAVNFRVDVFNVFNSKTALTVDENYTFDTVTPIAGLDCTSNYADAGDPVAALQADCPDLKYLKTVEGRPAEVNPNFGKANSFKAPLSARVSLSLTF